MKKTLSVILAILILCSVFVMPASALSKYANGKYAEQFEEYLVYLGFDPTHEISENWYTYKELYEHYGNTNTSQIPDWVLVSGYVGDPTPSRTNGIFGKYNLVLNKLCTPRDLYYIYVPSANTFITLGDAWTQEIEGIEKAFTEYLIPKRYAHLIEDSDSDGIITGTDARKYVGDSTFYNSFEKETECIYFDTNTTDWENYTHVYCHISGSSIFETPWQSEEELCTDENGDGVWEYNIYNTNHTLYPKAKYKVVFSNSNGDKTPEFTLTADNYMDVAYQTEGYTVGENGEKVFMPAWKNNPREIYFDANTTDWKDYEKIFCHIWEVGGDMFHAWQSRKELCLDENSDGIWEYNLDNAGVYLDESKEYGVIFSNEKGDQIYHLLLNSKNVGGTVELSGRFDETEQGTQYNVPVWHSAKLHFDTNTTNWEDFNRVYCHIFDYDYAYEEDYFFEWQSKKERCEDTDGDGIWTYDLDAMGIELYDDRIYVVIFSNENGYQTHNLIFDTTVLGDTAYVKELVAPDYNNSKVSIPYWRNQDERVFGPELEIYSDGTIRGTCVPRCVDEKFLFRDFLKYELREAQLYSGKTDQQLIDDLAKALDLTANEVEFIISDLEISSYDLKWKKTDSILDKSNITSPDEKDIYQVVRDYKKESGDKFSTKRYYFMMPNVIRSYTPETPSEEREENWTWYNEYSKTAYIYWTDTGRLDMESNFADRYSCSEVGYMAMNGDDYDIYYADVPDFVTSIIWTNGVKVADINDPMFEYAHRTEHIMCEYYDVGESELYPDGLDSFENMIYVLDEDAKSMGNPVAEEKGEWYYYYGDSCYGTVKNGDKYDCLNPHHYHRPQDTYIVAGVEKLCGSSWDVYDTNNKMTFNEDTETFEIIYKDVPVGNHEFMVTKNYQFGSLTPENPDYNEAKVTVDGSTVKITYKVGVGVEVTVTPPLLGDVDLDGVISVMDATEIQLAIAKRKTLTDEQKQFADTDFDGEISIMDATAIQLYVAKKITEFK